MNYSCLQLVTLLLTISHSGDFESCRLFCLRQPRRRHKFSHEEFSLLIALVLVFIVELEVILCFLAFELDGSIGASLLTLCVLSEVHSVHSAFMCSAIPRALVAGILSVSTYTSVRC